MCVIDSEVVSAIVSIQRRRAMTGKMCARLTNIGRACARTLVGYNTFLPKDKQAELKAAGNALYQEVSDAVRKERREKAKVREIWSDEGVYARLAHLDSEIVLPLVPAVIAADRYKCQVASFDKGLARLVKMLPVAVRFIEHPAQKGVGYVTIGQLIGEAGDLNHYPSPSRLWKLFGLFPVNGKAISRHRKEKTLSVEEWKLYGYAPRRHALAYVWASNILRATKDGPYRARYENGKRTKLAESGYKPVYAHEHGLVLMAKQLIKEFWIEWTNGGQDCVDTDAASLARQRAIEKGDPMVRVIR